MNNDNYNSWQIILIFFICGVIAMLCSCKSHNFLIEESDRLIDSIYITNYERDSIYLHDSIYHEVTVHGDSIFVLKERWHTAYRDRVKVDTFYQSKIDTVTIQMPPVMIEKKLSFMQQLYITLGTWAFYLMIAIAIIFVMKKF